MKRLMPHKNRVASALMEYALLIGVVAMALAAMNTYVKRGVQGKIAHMTDYFIGKEQAVDSNPTAEVASDAKSIYDSSTDTELLAGGGMRLVSLDNVHSVAKSRIVDEPRAPVTNGPPVPAERGAVLLPNPVTENDIRAIYDREQEEKKIQIDIQERKIGRLLAEARSLDESAAIIEGKANQTWGEIAGLVGRDSEIIKVHLVAAINNWSSVRTDFAVKAAAFGIGVNRKYLTGEVAEILKLAGPGKACQRGECAAAAIKLYRIGKDLLTQAAAQRAKAAVKRGEAQAAQEKIDRLNEEISGGQL
ncbi:MAG: hypothetical protein Q8O22_05455 [Candidatus Omnitrophota bacterium]|nr:hypothetical protein [Candidatus Omnitrophota bacterium]